MITRVKHNNQLPSVFIDNQLILSNPAENSLVLLNETATIIWQMYACGHDVNFISGHLQKQFQIDAEQMSSEVNLLIDSCKRNGLLGSSVTFKRNKRWNRNNDYTATTSASLSAVVEERFYQINKSVFKIEFLNHSVIDLLNPVLGHLQIKPSTKPGIMKNFQVFRTGHEKNNFFIESHCYGRSDFATCDELIEMLQWQIIEFGYHGRDWLTVLHSAALGTNNGKAIVFVAQRGSGKSTLTRLLQQKGFIYLADDVVPINKKGKLFAMPMCQRFKNGSWNILNLDSDKSKKTFARQEGHYVKYVAPLTGDVVHWGRKWPVNAIIYPRYDSNIQKPKFEKLTTIESLEQLCHSGSVFGGAIDQSQLESLVSWIKSIPNYSLSYNHVDKYLVNLIRKIS